MDILSNILSALNARDTHQHVSVAEGLNQSRSDHQKKLYQPTVCLAQSQTLPRLPPWLLLDCWTVERMWKLAATFDRSLLCMLQERHYSEPRKSVWVSDCSEDKSRLVYYRIEPDHRIVY
jgi:hypothetical protein